MYFTQILLWFIFLLSVTGCDRIYAVLHKPGGEERANLGAFEFNEYNARVEEVQRILKGFGYNIGRPDGKFGASTREAVARFQADEGIKVTRFVDKETWRRMQEYLEWPLFSNGAPDVRVIQKALAKAGFSAGKVDGQAGKRTRQAIRLFQAAQGLTDDGYLGLKTLKALHAYIDKPIVRVESEARIK